MPRQARKKSSIGIYHITQGTVLCVDKERELWYNNQG